MDKLEFNAIQELIQKHYARLITNKIMSLMWGMLAILVAVIFLWLTQDHVIAIGITIMIVGCSLLVAKRILQIIIIWRRCKVRLFEEML
ncbi:hypothetical protein WJU16_02715 [Chitinophaga pollutisoli]|uniref:Uncharacterized protein n=1 Tax=Chitinophaga pollutisoli TaxID=3133966 RepID=A0ABZ2YRJ8_9BACT